MKLFKKLFLLMLVVSVLFISCGNNEIKNPGNDNVPESNVPGTDNSGTDEPVLNPSLKGPDLTVNPDALNPAFYYQEIQDHSFDFPQNYLMAKMTDEQYKQFLDNIKDLIGPEGISFKVTKTPATGKFSVVVEGIATVIQYGDGSWYCEIANGYRTICIRPKNKLMKYDDLPVLPTELSLHYSGIIKLGSYQEMYNENYSVKEGANVANVVEDYINTFDKDEWNINKVPSTTVYLIENKKSHETITMNYSEKEIAFSKRLKITVASDDYTALGFVINLRDSNGNIVSADKMSTTPNYTKMTEKQKNEFNHDLQKYADDWGYDATQFSVKLKANESFTIGLSFKKNFDYNRQQSADGTWKEVTETK